MALIIQHFEKWLRQQGAEILPITNEHELLRFKGSETGVIYSSGKFNSSYVDKAIQAYKSGNRWRGKPISVGRKSSYKKQKKHIITRDGTKCFVCGKPLELDITLEHLIPLSSGGKNELSNMVLVHSDCNQLLSNKTIKEKVDIVLSKRISL